ncbi:MAG: Hemin uptake protein hemP [Planctomycetota bacterium]
MGIKTSAEKFFVLPTFCEHSPVPDIPEKPGVSTKITRSAEQPAGGIREVRFEQISGGQAELIVEHAGQKYRLIATKNGRLVLNK